MVKTSTDLRDDGERISIVSHALGIPIPTIRSWERRYGFPSPPRTGGRHRRYTPAEIAQLRAVRDLITRGERARAAIRAVHDEGAGLHAAGGALSAFAAAADAIDPYAVRRVLRESELALGPDRAITEIALPGMRAIGLRWRAGEVDVATEHAATEAVRGWIASLPLMPPPARRPILLACAPGEHHTLGLEAFAFILGRRGHSTRLLGANMPTSSLLEAAGVARARAAVLTAHRSVVRRSAIAALTALDRRSGMRVLFAGNAFRATRSRVGVPGIYLGEDLQVAASIVEAASR
jgi:MerR family transcriptional regulator, light-induced transcriptional regulator